MEKERLGSILPPLALLALVLALGFYLPAPLRDVLVQISKSLGTP
jgi:hypothetical protein